MIWKISQVCDEIVFFKAEGLLLLHYIANEGIFAERFGCCQILLKVISTLLKVTLLHECFSRFLNCINGTKSHKSSHLVFWSLHKKWSFPVRISIVNVTKSAGISGTLLKTNFGIVNFAKFLRTPFLQNTSGRLLLVKQSLFLITSQASFRTLLIPCSPKRFKL